MNNSNSNIPNRKKRVVKFVLKAILWLFATPLILLVSIILLLQVPQIQKFATSKAIHFLSDKIHTKVDLKKIGISFPKSVELNGLYIEDENADTLLYAQKIKVNINLLDLLKHKITVSNAELNTITGHINRNLKDTAFNFNFIVDAFSKPNKEVSTTKKDSTQKSWQFTIHTVQLHSIYFTYHDAFTGTNADLNLGNFETEIKTLDFKNKIIDINAVELNKTHINFTQNISHKIPEPKTESKPFDYTINVNSISLNTVNAIYNNTINHQHAALSLGNLIIKPEKINLAKEKIALKSIELSNTIAKYVIDATQVKEIDTISDVNDSINSKTPNWIVTLKKLDLNNNNFYFDNNKQPKTKTGVDYNHIYAANFNLHATDVIGNAKASSLKLIDLNFKEQCGFELKQFKGTLVYDTTHVDASNLFIETNQSTIQNHLGIRYKSIQAIGNNIGNLYTIAQLKDSKVAVNDILYFAPNLLDIKALNINKKTVININMDIKGIINDLSINKFALTTQKNTSINLKGSLKKVLSGKDLYIDLPLVDIESSRKELFSIISNQLIPKNIILPEMFTINGSVKGFLKNFNANLKVNTSIGNVLANIKMNPGAGNKEQPYEALVNVNGFDVGKLIDQPKTIGKVTLIASVNGSGFDTSNINTNLNIKIDKAFLKGYEYSDLKASGKILKKSFTGNASINDKNIVFNFDGSINFDAYAPKYVFSFDLKGADLKALNLSSEDARISTYITSNIQQQGDNIIGGARIKNTMLIKNNKKYPIDSIILNSTYKDGINEISLQSEIIEADFKGNIHIKEIAASFKNHFNSYFNTQPNEVPTKLQTQNFDFSINLIDPSLIVENLVPGLEKLSPSFIKGNYNSDTKLLLANLTVPQIKYSGTKIDSLKLNLNSDATALNYALTIGEVSNPTIKFENTSLRGDIKNDAISFQLSASKDDSVKMLSVGGVFKTINDVFELKLNPEFILNSQKWAVNQNNNLSFTKQGLIAHELSITNGSQLIDINSLTKTENAPLEIKFKNFDLSNISKILENKTELVKGEVNGNVTLEKQNNVSAFSSDVIVSNFVFQSVPIGTIKLKANNKQNAKNYVVDLNIEGNGNDIAMNGSYNVANSENALDFLLDIKNLNLKSVQPFTFGQVTRLSGNLNGKLNIKGSIALPDVNGDVHFKETTLNPKFIGSYLSLPDGKISFQNKKILLQNFTVIDSLNNKAIVSGTLDIKDFKNIGLDMRVKTANFLALNTTKKDNPLYFGTVFLDSDITIKGTTNTPNVKVKAKFNKGSGITYVKPESQVGKQENKGIVEFIDSLNTDKAIMIRQTDTIKQITQLKGIDLDATLTVDKTVQLKMLVDESSGDSLYIIGGGTLNFTLDQSGKTSLTGKYRITDGGYHLSISEVVKRDFKIEEGSSVTWSGDILDAYVDIKAVYKIKTSPIDLIQNDLAGIDDLEQNKYRNMLTFFVYLKMNGFLSAPEISFDIQLDPKDKGAVNGTVNAKLEELRGDETQLNKQVFALLTLRRFISDNPLDNGGSGGGLSSASRTSASKVLTQQLSSLSQKYVKAIDLDLGVNSFEDYSTGQEQGRTQLQVGVSKQLFQDKVTVRVGGNVELEGERAKQNNASDVAGNISIDYKLTNDGRYKLRGFRQNQYENPIEGEITKTGVGVVYVRNYNKLRELFSKPKSAKKQTEAKTK